jgi:hypothetical protein
MGWFSGESKTYKADPLAGDINNAAKTGLGYLTSGADKLKGVYDQDPSELVNTQIGTENKMIRGAANDALRRTQSLIAQRGMGNSSIGLGQQVNQAKQVNTQLGLNSASGIQRLRDMQLQNGQGIMNLGNSLYAPKAGANAAGIQMQDIKGPRSGGYGQLAMAGLGAAIGGYAGGGQGAAQGAQIGSSLGGSMQRQ